MPRPGRSSVSREIAVIRRSLASIEKAFGRLAPLLGTGGGSAAKGESPTPRRKLRLSPERRTALVLQGQYMGYLRGLGARQRAQVKAMRATKGVRAAIRLARSLGEG